MPTKPTDGALGYLDEQLDALKRHVPAALVGFDETGIHQARVATRRLKAGLDLLEPLVDKDDLRPLAKAGKMLRRRLGSLRDLDAILEQLRSYAVPERLKPGIAWTIERLEAARVSARQDDKRDGKRLEKQLAPFEAWWGLRHQLEQHAAAIDSILTEALHSRFHEFALDADRLAGLTQPGATQPELTQSGADDPPLDVHQLRISGKALRYTLEIAGAHGIKIPKSVFKSFKAMQESLGNWHDLVVLAEQTMQRSIESQLGHHDPAAAALVLDLAKLFLKDSAAALRQFTIRWRKSGGKIRRVLEDRVPLSRSVADEIGIPEPSTESQTGRDLPSIPTTPLEVVIVSDDPPVSSS
ncbi:MAG: CHAD domain-containing protein [Burkholderiales bacterium]|nr:CHAD domain-containing protein [Phycisphaerae bacterium]